MLILVGTADQDDLSQVPLTGPFPAYVADINRAGPLNGLKGAINMTMCPITC